MLRLIGEREAVRAGDLADELGMERLAFKADVRKLKALGLTESLGIGYRLSPRGQAWLERAGRVTRRSGRESVSTVGTIPAQIAGLARIPAQMWAHGSRIAAWTSCFSWLRIGCVLLGRSCVRNTHREVVDRVDPERRARRAAPPEVADVAGHLAPSPGRASR